MKKQKIGLMNNSFLQVLDFLNPLSHVRTKEILKVNPTIIPQRKHDQSTNIAVFEYNENIFTTNKLIDTTTCPEIKNNNTVKWMNVDGINKSIVEAIAAQFQLHFLLVEDILSIGQRPKMDEIDNHVFCLLNMLYFNKEKSSIEAEQISIVLGNDYVISFQEDANRDVFDSLRNKLQVTGAKIRKSTADYLCYTLIDLIVDNYFLVMDELGNKIEMLEEEIIRKPSPRCLAKINSIRKEIIVLKRNIVPLRELVNGYIRSDNPLISENNNKYFKDIYDHVIQAIDLVENYRDMMMSMQDLYINQVNLKMNEVMKVMAIVTCLLAPATVIGGIFGMNFEQIPYLHNQYGFYITVLLMLIIPIYMLKIFKGRGWF
jgi:magnesium transporter